MHEPGPMPTTLRGFFMKMCGFSCKVHRKSSENFHLKPKILKKGKQQNMAQFFATTGNLCEDQS